MKGFITYSASELRTFTVAFVLFNVFIQYNSNTMLNENLLEDLEFENSMTLLIQGMPSAIEKPFSKLSYAKNITPLLKTKKVDFALLFSVNQHQLGEVLKDVLPSLHGESKLWIAYPKKTSKVISDLNRNYSWDHITQHQYTLCNTVELDSVWTAILFKKNT